MRLILALALAVAGCAKGDNGDPETPRSGCTTDGDCARGFSCVAGACATPGMDGAVIDAGADTSVADVLVHVGDGRPVDGDSGAGDGAPGDAALDAEVVGDGPPPDGPVGPCVPGEVRDCGRNVGLCRAGLQTCLPDASWGGCEGSVDPRDEVCNGADDDCNGEIDDGFEVGAACEGVGACGAGAVECRSPVATRCSTEPGGSGDEAAAERCNGADDDCDGATDEGIGVGEDCVGRCGPGARECDAEERLVCSTDPGGSESEPRDEVCNQRDDDCDGAVDEGFGLGGACDGEGACGAGLFECSDDAGRVCSSDVGGSASEAGEEACNGVDDDCDGLVDEDFEVGAACEGVAGCGEGRTECTPGGDIRCSTDVGGSADSGRVVGAACGAVGVCPEAAYECSGGGDVVCATHPGGSDDRSGPEACNEADDDCDGSADEGLDLGAACRGMGNCGGGVRECDARGGVQCSTAPGGSADASGGEACDGEDDDCDGAVDEGDACGGDTCETAPELPLGAVASGNTSRLDNDYDRSNCRGDAPGPEQVYRLEIPAPGRYAVAVAPTDGAYEPLFWVGGACNVVTNCPVANAGDADRGAGRPLARIIDFPRADTFHLVVDARLEQHGGPFVATVRPVGEGERCGNAIELDIPGRFAGITSSRDRDVLAEQCPPGTSTFGPDQVFRIDLEAPRRVRATVTPAADLDVVLSVVGNCGAPDDDCAGGANAGARGVAEEVDVQLEAGTWYLVVDHPGNAGGPFLLEVE